MIHPRRGNRSTGTISCPASTSRNTSRLGSGRCWCVFHLARNRATFGRNCSLAISVFFDGRTRLADKAPDRVMRHTHTTHGPLRRQCPHRQLGLLGKSHQQPVPALARECRATTSPNLARNLPTARALPLTDTNGRSHGHTEPLRNRPNRLTLLQCRRDPHPQIYRKWCYHALPHHLVKTVGHQTSSMGIPVPIQSGKDMLVL